MQQSSESQPQATLVAKRQQWLAVLTQEKEALSQYDQALSAAPYEVLRAPEVGMAMVKGQTAGEGQVFNLGEVTVTRCVVRLDSGEVGYGYVVGRSKEQARLLALADAHLQSPQHDHWANTLLVPLSAAQQQKIKQQQQQVAATKVDFFTLVRGED